MIGFLLDNVIGVNSIPIVNFEDGTSTALDDSELPLVLPKLQDYAPSKMEIVLLKKLLIG